MNNGSNPNILIQKYLQIWSTKSTIEISKLKWNYWSNLSSNNLNRWYTSRLSEFDCLMLTFQCWLSEADCSYVNCSMSNCKYVDIYVSKFDWSMSGIGSWCVESATKMLSSLDSLFFQYSTIQESAVGPKNKIVPCKLVDFLLPTVQCQG